MATDLTLDEQFEATSDELSAKSVARVVAAEVAELGNEDHGFELFRDWIHSDRRPKYGKFSYIQGVLEAEMSPESLFDHNQVKLALTIGLGLIIQREQLGRSYPDGALLVREDIQLASEPDFMFCTWATLREKRIENRPYKKAKRGKVEVHGSPDLVVEIVSNSSVKKDKVRLKQAYFQAGISEYWLIDARDSRLEFSILQRGDAGYVATLADQEGFRFSAVFNRTFTLDRHPDPVGEDAYQLLSR